MELRGPRRKHAVNHALISILRLPGYQALHEEEQRVLTPQHTAVEGVLLVQQQLLAAPNGWHCTNFKAWLQSPHMSVHATS